MRVKLLQRTKDRLTNLAELRRQLIERSGGRCEECQDRRRDWRGLQMSHIQHRKMGGDPSKDTLENTRLLCAPCHDDFDRRTN